MKPKNNPQGKNNGDLAAGGAAVMIIVLMIAIVVAIICMRYWPETTMGVSIIAFAVIGLLLGLLFDGGNGAAWGCSFGVGFAFVLCFVVYMLLALSGWQSPDEVARKAEAARVRAEYITLCEQLDKQPAIDAARRELILKIWEQAPERALDIAGAALAQPPRIPTTRDLLAELEPHSTQPQTEADDAKRIRLQERSAVENEKRHAEEKREREELERRGEASSKWWDIFRRIEKKDPERAKKMKEVPDYYPDYRTGRPGKPSYEELLNILTEIEEQEAARATAPTDNTQPPPSQ